MKLAVHRIPGLVLTDHRFVVRLDHKKPRGEKIAVFAREAVAAGREKADLPWLMFLQGGPGSAAGLVLKRCRGGSSGRSPTTDCFFSTRGARGGARRLRGDRSLALRVPSLKPSP